MRKFNLFNFLGKKIDSVTMEAITAAAAEVSFRELALHIGVSYIANTLSKCEIKVYEKNEAVKNKLYYMLNVSPNANENSSQFMNKTIERYYYEGSALWVPYNDQILCADSFDVDDSNPLKEFTYTNVLFGSHEYRKKYKASELFLFKLDDKKVTGLVNLLYEKYGELINLAVNTFKRTNGKKYKLILENYQAGDPSFVKVFNEVIKKNLQTFIDNDNSVFPEFKGMNLQEFSTATPTNSNDIIALRKEVFETTAQALKIPLSMMLGNITNMNEIVKVYLSICIDPLADMISEELTRKYYTFEEWKGGNYIKVDTSRISHVDILEVADAVEKLISSGALNIDEVRERLDKKPLNTKFSKSYFMTKNFDLAENILKNGGEVNS